MLMQLVQNLLSSIDALKAFETDKANQILSLENRIEALQYQLDKSLEEVSKLSCEIRELRNASWEADT